MQLLEENRIINLNIARVNKLFKETFATESNPNNFLSYNFINP